MASGSKRKTGGGGTGSGPSEPASVHHHPRRIKTNSGGCVGKSNDCPSTGTIPVSAASPPHTPLQGDVKAHDAKQLPETLPASFASSSACDAVRRCDPKRARLVSGALSATASFVSPGDSDIDEDAEGTREAEYDGPGVMQIAKARRLARTRNYISNLCKSARLDSSESTAVDQLSTMFETRLILWRP